MYQYHSVLLGSRIIIFILFYLLSLLFTTIIFKRCCKEKKLLHWIFCFFNILKNVFLIFYILCFNFLFFVVIFVFTPVGMAILIQLISSVCNFEISNFTNTAILTYPLVWSIRLIIYNLPMP